MSQPPTTCIFGSVGKVHTSPVAERSLEAERWLQSVLTGAHARAMHLTFEGVRVIVTRQALGQVANAVGRELQVWHIPERSQSLVGLVYYVPSLDAFLFPARFTEDRVLSGTSAVLLHEAVHALFDRDRVQTPPGVEEAVAYISQLSYWAMDGVGKPRRMDPRIRPVIDAAWEVVGYCGLSEGTGHVTADAIHSLAATVSRSPIYKQRMVPTAHDGWIGDEAREAMAKMYEGLPRDQRVARHRNWIR